MLRNAMIGLFPIMQPSAVSLTVWLPLLPPALDRRYPMLSIIFAQLYLKPPHSGQILPPLLSTVQVKVLESLLDFAVSRTRIFSTFTLPFPLAPIIKIPAGNCPPPFTILVLLMTLPLRSLTKPPPIPFHHLFYLLDFNQAYNTGAIFFTSLEVLSNSRKLQFIF